MKKTLLFISSLFLLVGCNAETKVVTTEGTEVKHMVSYVNRLPVVLTGESTHTTYLLLSPFGTVEIDGVDVKGGDVPELFYNNAIVWKAEPGTDLPDASKVKSTVKGATFRGWAYYDEDNDNVFPDYYTKVPVKDGLALKAIFDGTTTGGGGGGGEVNPGTNITYSVTNFPSWVANDGAVLFAWTWGGTSGTGTWSKIEISNNGHNINGSFVAPSDIVGFNMARCSKGTTLPNWEVFDNSAGRVYNKSADVSVTSGITSYSSPEFTEYPSGY